MSNSMHGPTSHTYFSQRLRLHYVDWGNPEAPPMIMIHGTRDHCRNWDWVAERLRDDYHIIAPDLRGHGDSEWARGSQYALVDYVLDIAQLLEQLQLQLRAVGDGAGLLFGLEDLAEVVLREDDGVFLPGAFHGGPAGVDQVVAERQMRTMFLQNPERQDARSLGFLNGLDELFCRQLLPLHGELLSVSGRSAQRRDFLHKIGYKF